MDIQNLSDTEKRSELKRMVNSIGSQRQAAELFLRETGYKLPQATISRILNGEGKPAMLHLVLYGFKNALTNQQ